MDTKQRIEFLLRSTERQGIRHLLQWMDENGFYTAPCSSKYHLAQPGGLAEHSLNVYTHAETMLYALHPSITPELVKSVIICALLHDLGKAGQFGKPNYIRRIDGETGETSFATNKELLYIPHEVRSIAIASEYIDLTESEQFAILYHNGLYGELQSVKNHETPLYMILHFADMWASRVTEKEDTK